MGVASAATRGPSQRPVLWARGSGDISYLPTPRRTGLFCTSPRQRRRDATLQTVAETHCI